MSRQRLARLCAITCVFFAATAARADSLFLPAAIQQFNVYATNVDVNYKVFDIANNIGKFAADGVAKWFADPAQTITNGTYHVNIYFDLLTGNVRTNDPLNVIDVAGTFAGGPKTFFHSSTLKLFGSGAEDTFDVVFKNNDPAAFVKPGSDIMTRIMGVSIPNFSSPTFLFAPPPATPNGFVIFDNTTAGGIEKGVANVWAPAPKSAQAGFVLLIGYGASLAFRKWVRQGWRRA
jgi:hypothetical protein